MRQNDAVPDPIIEVHDGVRYIICPYSGCNRRVKKMWNYYSHAHQRPYECSICKQSFRWQSSLKSHMRSHERRAGIASSSASPSSHNTPSSSSYGHGSSSSSSSQRPQLPSVQALLGPDYHPRNGGSPHLPPAHQSRQHQNANPRSSTSPPAPIHPSHSRRVHRETSQHNNTSSTRSSPRHRQYSR